MIMQRYFTDKKQDNTFILNENDLYHIKTVMRMNDFDQIEVVYEKEVYTCYIKYSNTNIEVIIKEKIDYYEYPMPYISLVLPLLKEQKLDIILQKATELGVNEIIFTNMTRSIIKLDDKKLENKLIRWSRICKEASEQSMRNTIPNLTFIRDFKALKELDGINIICSTQEKKKTVKNVLKNVSICDRINIVIGPEGGISPNEEEFLESNGFIKTTLGSRIMRVETVPIYLLSIINYEFME